MLYYVNMKHAIFVVTYATCEYFIYKHYADLIHTNVSFLPNARQYNLYIAHQVNKVAPQMSRSNNSERSVLRALCICLQGSPCASLVHILMNAISHLFLVCW